MSQILRTFGIVCAAGILPLLVADPVAAIDLGDLNISSSRLAKKNGGETGWSEPSDIGFSFTHNGRPYPSNIDTWTEYNVTNSADMSALGCSVMVPNDNNSDHNSLSCAVRSTSGDPDGKIIYIPQGVYNIRNRVYTKDENDDTLIRGDGMGATVLEADFNTASLSSSSADFPECRGKVVLQFCPGGTALDFARTNWTGGYDLNATTITVSNASLFTAGRWLKLRGRPANSDPEWAYEKGKSGQWTFQMIVKIVSKNGNQLVIDRPLTIDMNGGKQREAEQLSDSGKDGVLERAGIEDLTISNPGHQTDGDTSLTSIMSVTGCSQCWVRGVEFRNGYTGFVNIGDTRMLLFEGNKLADLWWTSANYGSAVYIRGTHDSVFENNWHADGVHRLFTLEDGPARNVLGYNYGPSNNKSHERFIFFHGDNPAVNLVEGNSVKEGRIETDRFWGRSGEYNTFYRNRTNAPNYCFDADDHKVVNYPTTCTSNSQCSGSDYCSPYSRDGIVTEGNSVNALAGARNSIDNNYMLNATGSFHDWFSCKSGGTSQSALRCKNWDVNPSSDTIPYGQESFWLEHNLARNISISPNEGDPNSDCGDGTGKSGCLGTNTEGNTHSCSGLTFPDSLYRDAQPEWWCEEACDWNVLNGIGACGDDISPANVDATSNLCKLPAQILAEGGTCTRGSGPPPPPPLPAPVLLP